MADFCSWALLSKRDAVARGVQGLGHIVKVGNMAYFRAEPSQ